jgi:hypothetical protein
MLHFAPEHRDPVSRRQMCDTKASSSTCTEEVLTKISRVMDPNKGDTPTKPKFFQQEFIVLAAKA